LFDRASALSTVAFLASFRPHPLLWNGHVQTLAAAYLMPAPRLETTERHLVHLDDGDRLALHDDCPADWRPGDRCVLLIHGLSGCHGSPYLRRITSKLMREGKRVFRLDQRGSGAGALLANFTYHSGRSQDVTATCRLIGALTEESPLAVAGFSLGGNLTLKMVGDHSHPVPGNVDRVMAVCPPVDLSAVLDRLAIGLNQFYDRYFAKSCVQQVLSRARQLPEFALPDAWRCADDEVSKVKSSLGRGAVTCQTASGWVAFRQPRGMREFDDAFTAPLAGYPSGEVYYDRCSSAQFVPTITTPTLIIASQDDPMIPPETILRLDRPTNVQVEMAPGGGHLGFIGQGRHQWTDGCWLDARIATWLRAA
jgi:uncharacterized protein